MLLASLVLLICVRLIIMSFTKVHLICTVRHHVRWQSLLITLRNDRWIAYLFYSWIHKAVGYEVIILWLVWALQLLLILLWIILGCVDYQRAVLKSLIVKIILLLRLSFTRFSYDFCITISSWLIGTKWSSFKLMKTIFHWMIGCRAPLFMFQNDSLLFWHVIVTRRWVFHVEVVVAITSLTLSFIVWASTFDCTY